ncbi:50S ribosomal protein L25/general stress protein Ctc [Enterococcus durans]|uniref:50S ribosomal protein L25/general stress protein Ctc n=1 Tax=Enterococcus durans TaxID=53345 RepID=UPI0010217510|nr:50S ribosomal protein L25/general stress protein Ctc [Enterococcus durans]MZG89744.1 50S ribosomal protein L25/general stress protein Ctc [Enterococcus durans]MZG93129.1 50S ribosomal protein L25/general stress protein Ctc [Enterococcus durans]MZH20078.1 50S ribosomal protein L25/general stress protein Ctc [Enterococcus durans]MZH22811.1 50S ribosomal protein L25/general stress protein Ctc [Enterococcus durans]MZH24374.1 50S ribosomal protein L25/general stress protein Ctc [Enterococcus dur
MSVSLEVSKREVRPRSLRNKLRHEGKVPAIVYGYNVESTPISFDGQTFSKLLRENGANTVVTMDIDGNKVNTLVHKVQTNTFTNHFEHVEFLSVNMSEETEVETEIVLIGEAAGAKSGGVLAQNLYTVLVSATPDNLPERIEVDVTNLDLGDSITVADLPENNEYKVVTDSEEQIAAVVAPAEETETTDVASEPEVIGSPEE